jgi:hypothetical protein
MRRNRANHIACDEVLKFENIFERSVEPISPKVSARSSVQADAERALT